MAFVLDEAVISSPLDPLLAFGALAVWVGVNGGKVLWADWSSISELLLEESWLIKVGQVLLIFFLLEVHQSHNLDSSVVVTAQRVSVSHDHGTVEDVIVLVMLIQDVLDIVHGVGLGAA